MSEVEFQCPNCGRSFPASKLDRRLWCPDCRKIVVHRARWVGRGVGLLFALGLVAWIVASVGPTPRFLVAYAIMIGTAYFFVSKLTQRVAFEIIRSRGVPPPKIDEKA